MERTERTAYEQQLGFNVITRWLHSFRYRHALNELRVIPSPVKVLEIGCAEGRLFEVLNENLDVSYTGIDVRQDFITTATKRYGDSPAFRAICRSAEDLSGIEQPDVVMALETFEHIPEDRVVRIVEEIARIRPKLFICSVPVEIGPSIWFKNVGSLCSGYNRHREYTWPETLWAGLYQLDRIPRHGCGHKGFDWRWLAQTIRHNMRIRQIRRFPANFLPTAFAASVFMIAEPR